MSQRLRFVAPGSSTTKSPKPRYLDLELKDPQKVVQEIADRLRSRRDENHPCAYVVLGLVEYKSLQMLAFMQPAEEPNSGKQTIFGLTVLVDGLLGVRVLGPSEYAANELINHHAK